MGDKFSGPISRWKATWSRYRFLILVLGVPGTAASVGFAWLSYRASDQWREGLLLDLAVTSLGILITVFYVDVVLNRHEDRRWEPLRAIASNRIKNFATRAIDVSVWSDPDLDRRIRYSAKQESIRVNPLNYWADLHSDPEWREYVRDTAIPSTPEWLRHKSPDELAKLRSRLVHCLSEAPVLLAYFREVLTPSQLSCLSDLQALSGYAQGPVGEYFYEKTTQVLTQAATLNLELIEKTD